MKAASQPAVSNSNTWASFWLELPFWLVFVVWTLLPDTKTPRVTIESIPLNIKDVGIIMLAGFYLFMPVMKNLSDKTTARPWYWHAHLPILTAIMLLYALGSTVESDMNPRDGKAMVYTLILAASVFTLSFLAIAKMPNESIRKFLWRMTVFLAFTGLIYTIMSFTAFEMGDVGASANADLEAQGFGSIARVKGPLYISDNGYFVLIPALAFAIQELIANPRQKLLKTAVIFTLMLTLLGLGSRAALVIMFLFFLMLLLFLKNKKQAIAAIVLLVTIVSIASWVVFSKADASRLQSLEDTSRSETHTTAVQIVTNREFELNIIGSGYGSYWPSWYLYDSTGDDLRDLGLFYTLVYPYGHIIYHPHSTFLIFFVELGLVGWLYFIYLWVVLISLLVSNLRGSIMPIFNCGLAASGLSMFFEFFIFKNYQVTVIWLLFLFGALWLKHEKSNLKTLNKSFITK